MRRCFSSIRSSPLLPALSRPQPATYRIVNSSPFAVQIAAMPLSNHSVPPLRDESLLKPYAFLNGDFLKVSSTGETFTVTDPATGIPIADLPDQSVPDVKAAVAAAEHALKSFRRTTARERARMLRAWYEQMIQHKEDLATLITWENGKPLADSRGEALYAANFLEWFSEEAPRLYGSTVPSSFAANRIITHRVPVGVCALITPWNFPAAMVTRKVGPAIAAGCTVVLKAPGETPLTALALAELANRAGIPKGVINVVTTLKHTADVGKELCENPVIRKLSFTGSTNVGKLLMKQSAGTLKKLSFELGGNAPFIVFDDADLDAAVAGAVASKFRCSGQTCVCANRIFIQDGIYDAFAEKFAEKVRAFSVGSGYDASNTHGPLIHTRAINKVHSHVQDAVASGATLLLGGEKRVDLGENFYQPTVLTGASKEMALFREETFGPVAPLFRFKSEREVVELANEASVGLAAYFYSKDVARVWRVSEALDVGMVGINSGILSDPAFPFGGVKESGFGREGGSGGSGGIDEYTVVKSWMLGGMDGELQG